MRKAFLMFLTLSEAIACAASYSKQFGDAGRLLIQYEVVTTKLEISYIMVENSVSGTLTNTTKLPISCTRIDPIVSGTAYMMLGLRSVSLDAEASQKFSNHDDVYSPTNVSRAGISGWEVECATPLDYQFSNQEVTKNFSAGVITGVIGRKQIGITVENNSDQPIEIVWNDSSFIDMNRSAKRIFHSGVKFTDREQALPNTTIPPLAKAEDAVIPAANVHFVEGRYGGWTERPLFPSEVPPELAEKAMASMNGAKVALYLQLLIGGKKTPVTLLFEVAAVKGGNPK
jgi:hypothetical protein